MENNPFQAPESLSRESSSSGQQTYPDAGNGKRFLNFLIDYVAFQVFMMCLGFAAGIAAALHSEAMTTELMLFLEGPGVFLISLCVYYGAYVLMEGFFGATLGKLITGTRVVDERTQQSASFLQLLGRTASRMIPFEPFSFLGSKPGGWHDHLSKTRVMDKRAMPLSLEEYDEIRRALP